jgi:hypothetical protein
VACQTASLGENGRKVVFGLEFRADSAEQVEWEDVDMIWQYQIRELADQLPMRPKIPWRKGAVISGICGDIGFSATANLTGL